MQTPPSLARYAVARSPGVDIYNGNPSRDFCNSFWGQGDAGVNILLARVKGVIKTSEELVSFWNERALAEEEYANRLSALSRMSLGSEEIGDLRAAIDTVRHEAGKQAEFHLELAKKIRQDEEVITRALLDRQIERRNNEIAPIERQFKAKFQQESYVQKAREKYEGDCLRIASYTQQINNNTATSPGDLDRLQTKLKRVQQTVQANERDLINFTRGLTEMLPEWQKEWKRFCDDAQDWEEERTETLKDALWTFANDVSTGCVNDDLSCERLRVALDEVDTRKELEGFVHEYGTGNAVPNPPVFVPYPANGDAASGSSPHSAVAPLTVTHANFERETQRTNAHLGLSAPENPTQQPIIPAPAPAPAPALAPAPPPAPAPAPAPTPAPATAVPPLVAHSAPITTAIPQQAMINYSPDIGRGGPLHPAPSGNLPPAPGAHIIIQPQQQQPIPSDPAPGYPPDPYLPYGAHRDPSNGAVPAPGYPTGGLSPPQLTPQFSHQNTPQPQANGYSMNHRLDMMGHSPQMQGQAPQVPPPMSQQQQHQLQQQMIQQQQQQQQQRQQHQQQPQPQQQQPPPASVPGSVGAPPPVGQPLFYVQARYDYRATVEEEFDFQEGDIIAVFAAPDDGWWSGELLDEARREPGRNIFPSNFVVLF